jgi:hypothetical protein
VVATDGDNYDVFNAHEGVAAEQRQFDAIRITEDEPAETLEFFDLFARSQIEENRIECFWRRRLADRQVEELLKGLLTPESALVQLLLRESSGLSAKEIRSALARAKVCLEFECCDRLEGTFEEEMEGDCGRVAGMSDAELRIATWLQHRSIERWAKGATTTGRNRTSQRRVLENRRSSSDRRSGPHDRRVARVSRAQERRAVQERRSNERRENADRRVTNDRRRVRKRA